MVSSLEEIMLMGPSRSAGLATGGLPCWGPGHKAGARCRGGRTLAEGLPQQAVVGEKRSGSSFHSGRQSRRLYLSWQLGGARHSLFFRFFQNCPNAGGG